MKYRLLFLVIFFILILSPVFALNEKNTIRIGLSNQSFSTQEFQSITLKSVNIIKIIDTLNNINLDEIPAEKLVNVSMIDDLFQIKVDDEIFSDNLQGPLLISSNAELQIMELNRKGTPAKYKGMIELNKSKSPDKFNVINIIDIQNYLRGVVPNEMPVSFGLEASKAQAVAARNYVYNANISNKYDVVDSTASQVYYGANSYSGVSDKAVNETKGIYALYKDKPISALYFSTSPGITDDWDDVFGGGYKTNSYPYLKARYDKNNQKPLLTENDVKEFYSRNDNGFDINSPKFRWTVEFTKEELEEILNKTLLEQSKSGLVSPKFDPNKPLEGLKEIKPLKRTQSGKITELMIKSNSGDYVIKKELGIRKIFKKNNTILPSANFYIETKGREVEKKEENSIFDFFNFEEKYPENYKFIGGGFGHGVGMSQFGAYNLSKMGKKYPEILKHYYTDINISTLPKTVLYNEYNVHYKTEFYYDRNTYKNVYLYITNEKSASEFPFKINEFDFSQTKQIASNRSIKINITRYLNQGVNIIDFNPLGLENKGKYVVYRVEFL